MIVHLFCTACAASSLKSSVWCRPVHRKCGTALDLDTGLLSLGIGVLRRAVCDAAELFQISPCPSTDTATTVIVFLPIVASGFLVTAMPVGE
jgi:hypothetical protein